MPEGGLMKPIWVCIPTASVQRAKQFCQAWHKMGYLVALLRNKETASGEWSLGEDFSITAQGYPGWGNSINLLISHLIESRLACDWFVGAGDDMLPDQRLWAGAIGQECSTRFNGTFGVMQPTGDRWGTNIELLGSISDRICGSPWLGRSFCERWNQGEGAFWHEYHHFYADEELHDVTLKHELLWQRRDLTQHHDHWQRTHTPMPDYMEPVQALFEQDKALFNKRKAAGFPYHEAIPQTVKDA